jgi:hypothetical protein
MEAPDGPRLLVLLERAEIAARERRLTAMADADRLVAEAEVRSAAVTGSAAERATAAVGAFRARSEAEAARAIAELERERAALSATIDAEGPADPRFELAVACVVAAVLGEDVQWPGGGSSPGST